MTPFCLTTRPGYWAAWARTGSISSLSATFYRIIPKLSTLLRRSPRRRRRFYLAFYTVFKTTAKNLSARRSIYRETLRFLAPLGFGIFCRRRLITSTLLGKNWLEAADFIGVWSLARTAIIPTSYFSAKIGFETTFCRSFCALVMSASVLGVLRLIPGTFGEIVGVAAGIAIIPFTFTFRNDSERSIWSRSRRLFEN